MLRYLEAFSAYIDMQDALIVRPQITTNDIADVKDDFIKQIVNPLNGNILGWVGCRAYLGDFTPVCDPSSLVVFCHQHPYDVGFVPAQALAARLLSDDGRQPNIAASLTTRRAAARVYSPSGGKIVKGQFKTNAIPIESVTAGIWDGAETWNESLMMGDYLNGVFFARYDVFQTGDWHMLENGKGKGNYGNR